MSHPTSMLTPSSFSLDGVASSPVAALDASLFRGGMLVICPHTKSQNRGTGTLTRVFLDLEAEKQSYTNSMIQDHGRESSTVGTLIGRVERDSDLKDVGHARIDSLGTGK